MIGIGKKVFSQSDEQGLAMAGDFITSSLEPKPIEKPKLKITTKSQITNVKLELKLIANYSRR